MTIGRGAVAVTLSDTAEIAKDAAGRYPIALRFGTGGTASVLCANGQTIVLTNIADGESIPVAAKRVNLTGSSGVADIVGFYP